MSNPVLNTDEIQQRITRHPGSLLSAVKAASGAKWPAWGEAGARAWALGRELEVGRRLTAMHAAVVCYRSRDPQPAVTVEGIEPAVMYPVIASLLSDEEQAKFWAYGALLRSPAYRNASQADQPRYLRAVRDFLAAELVQLLGLETFPGRGGSEYLSLQAARDNPHLIRGLQRWGLIGEENEDCIPVGDGFTLLREILNDGLAVLAEMIGKPAAAAA